MRLVSYTCFECMQKKEELFNDTEEDPEVLEEPCDCGGQFQKFNVKDNSHRVYIQDRSGL